jgi:hypothetical protein
MLFIITQQVLIRKYTKFSSKNQELKLAGIDFHLISLVFESGKRIL